MCTKLNVDCVPGGNVVMSLKRVLWYCPFKNLSMESFGACYLKNDIVASGGVECCFFSTPPPPHQPQLYKLNITDREYVSGKDLAFS